MKSSIHIQLKIQSVALISTLAKTTNKRTDYEQIISEPEFMLPEDEVYVKLWAEFVDG